MKKLILLLLFAGCRKLNYSPVNVHKKNCKDYEGVWYCTNANIDSLVIKYLHSKNDTSYYTSNHPEFNIKHECPYKWKSDNLYFTYDGFTYEFRH